MDKLIRPLVATLCATTMCTSIIPQAFATNTNDDEPQFALTSYTADLNKAYVKDIRDAPSPQTQEGSDSVALENATSLKDSFSDYGFTVNSISTESHFVSCLHTDNGTSEILAYLTTQIDSKLPEGTTSTIAPNGILHSSLGDYHRITFSDYTNPLAKSHYTVLSDQILDTESTDEASSLNQYLLPNPSSTDISQAHMPQQTTASPRSTYKETINVSKAVNYALKWTSAPYDDDKQEDYNPAFPYYGENCANFASQILYTGGLPKVQGNIGQRKNLDIWTWELSGAFGGHTPSNTWSLAEDNYFHMRDYANWSNRVNNIYETPQMGLIYTDWTSDHTIDHVMFVIDNIPVPNSSHAGYKPMPIICQKSNNRNAVPLSTEMTYAHKKHPKDTISWFGLSANAKVRFI